MSPSSTSSSDPGPDPEGLVVLPGEVGGAPGLRRWLLILVLGTFGLAVLGTLAVDLLEPRELPQLVGKERRTQERIRREASLWDGSLARLFEADMRARSRVRSLVVPPFAWGLYRFLAEGKGVHVGREGWLFLASRAHEPVIPIPKAARRVANQFAALDRLFDSRGTRLIAIPVPRKAVVLEELLPPGVHPGRGFEEQLVARMKERGVVTADLLGAFADRDAKTLFHLGDSHWTPDAERVAAEEVARVSGQWLPPEQRDTELSVLPGDAYGLDLFRWIGAGVEEPTDPRVVPHLRDDYQVVLRATGELLKRSNSGAMGSMALVGTSFTARRALHVYVRHFTGQSVWNAASPGEGPMIPLRQFLVWRGERPWPESLLLEFPVHLVLSGNGMPSLGRIFAGWSPAAWTPVPCATEWSWLDAKFVPGRWNRVAALPTGALGRSADGTVYLRLVARERAAGSEFQILSPGFRLESPWPPGKEELVLPLMGDDSGTGRLTVAIRCRNGEPIELESIEVVTPLAEEPVAEAVLESPNRRAPERWEQVARFPDGLVLPEQGALDLECSVAGKWAVELEFEGQDGPERAMDLQPVQAGARILLGLAGYAGRTLNSVKVVALGAPGSEGLARVSVRAPIR